MDLKPSTRPEPSRRLKSASPKAPLPAIMADDPPRRRHVLKGVFGAMIGGALGYGAYPWVAGDRRQELAQALGDLWDRIKENPRARGRSRRQIAGGSPHEVPVILDAHGREYEAFLAGLGLRHLKPLEILRPHFKQRGTVVNTLPPKELWRNLAATLRVADELRQHLGVKLLTIASAYRSPAYNAACPGAATSSYHMQNMALDLMFDCAPELVATAAEALRARGVFSGGIGRYASFTHVDTRGKNADW